MIPFKSRGVTRVELSPNSNQIIGGKYMHKPRRAKKMYQRTVQKNPIKKGYSQKSSDLEGQSKKKKWQNEPWTNDPFDKKDF